MIVWITGQPGSGKSTLGRKIFEKLNITKSVHIDGDDIFNFLIIERNDILPSIIKVIYSEGGIKIDIKCPLLDNVKIAQNVVRVYDDMGYLVVVSLVAPNRDLREELKSERDVIEFYSYTTRDHKFDPADNKINLDTIKLDNYEPPIENFKKMDTDKSIEYCLGEMYSAIQKRIC
jgi:adenylylsulfate kinase-like enzyme